MKILNKKFENKNFLESFLSKHLSIFVEKIARVLNNERAALSDG